MEYIPNAEQWFAMSFKTRYLMKEGECLATVRWFSIIKINRKCSRSKGNVWNFITAPILKSYVMQAEACKRYLSDVSDEQREVIKLAMPHENSR
jgi:hypothetical protein